MSEKRLNAIRDEVYEKLDALRTEYRTEMNRKTDMVHVAAQDDDMENVSLYSTEAERARTAFNALNRAIKIVEEAIEK
jgi:hypothetical protein